MQARANYPLLVVSAYADRMNDTAEVKKLGRALRRHGIDHLPRQPLIEQIIDAVNARSELSELERSRILDDLHTGAAYYARWLARQPVKAPCLDASHMDEEQARQRAQVSRRLVEEEYAPLSAEMLLIAAISVCNGRPYSEFLKLVKGISLNLYMFYLVWRSERLTLTDEATGPHPHATINDWRRAGWSDQQLMEHGYATVA